MPLVLVLRENPMVCDLRQEAGLPEWHWVVSGVASSWKQLTGSQSMRGDRGKAVSKKIQIAK